MPSLQYAYYDAAPQQHEVVYLRPVSSASEIPSIRPTLTPLQKWGYGLLVAGLVFTGIQVLRCGIVSAFKIQGLLKQQVAVGQYYQQAQTTHEQLANQIALYQSPLGVEEIARERLGMVGANEVLVRVYPTAVAQR